MDGHYLNYDSNPLRTIDFTGLCAEMVKLQAPNKKIGKHSSVGDDDLKLYWEINVTIIQFLPRDDTRRAVLRLHVVCLSVCPSVCLSVCDVQVQCSHRLEFFENNFTGE